MLGQAAAQQPTTAWPNDRYAIVISVLAADRGAMSEGIG